MKSFRNHISEVAAPKPAEEKAFWDQHNQATGKHPVADDAQFKGTAKSKAKRSADQEGDANYDKAVMNKDTRMKGAAVGVNEAADTASPDESSMAMDQADFIAYVAREMKEHLKANKEFPEWMQNKLSKLQQAAQDLHGNFGAHGDDMDEALVGGQKKLDHNKNGKLDAHDFKLMRSKKMKEAVEQIDEISKTKMGQYIKRAHADKDTQTKRASIFDKKGMDADKDKDMYSAWDKANKARKKADNRTKFIGKAVDRITKEEVELDEVSQETLRNYHGKAGADLQAKRAKVAKGELSMADLKKGQNRVKGLNRAANKMEEVEVTETTSSALKRPVTMTGPDGKTRTVMRKAKADRTDDRGQDQITTRESVEVMDEAFRQGIVKLNDKSQMILKKEDADALNNLFKGMSAGNRNKMTKEAMENKKAFEEILSFAKEA